MPDHLHLDMRQSLQSPEGKRCFNEEHFAVAARRYDLATGALSLGRDRHWKRQLAAALPDRTAPVCLDLACGTGDVAFLLADRYRRGHVLGLDLTAAMVERARARNRFSHVRFVVRDMTETRLADQSVDIVTGAYALRNAPDLSRALAEIHRVMKPGAVAAFLDFAKPSGPRSQRAALALLRVWGGFWGLVFHGNPTVHGYIAESLRTFPDRPGLARLIEQTGFVGLTRQPRFFGLTEILRFERPA